MFSALRGYVLSQSKFLGLLIFVLSMTQVGVNLVSAVVPFPLITYSVQYTDRGIVESILIQLAMQVPLFSYQPAGMNVPPLGCLWANDKPKTWAPWFVSRSHPPSQTLTNFSVRRRSTGKYTA